MKRTVTHMVGPHVNLGIRVIQRCAICGEKLLDTQYQAAVGESGKELKAHVWPFGRLVRFSVGDAKPRSEVLLPPSERLPEDSCLELVE